MFYIKAFSLFHLQKFRLVELDDPDGCVGVFIQAVFIPRILFMGILVKKKKLLTMLVVNNTMKVKVEQSVIGNHMIPRAIWNK